MTTSYLLQIILHLLPEPPELDGIARIGGEFGHGLECHPAETQCSNEDTQSPEEVVDDTFRHVGASFGCFNCTQSTHVPILVSMVTCHRSESERVDKEDGDKENTHEHTRDV